jgi:hypothetical protein
LILLLMAPGCPQASRVSIYLNLVAEGAASIVTALAASGVIPPAVATQVTTYAKMASHLVLDINTELASADSKAIQWTKISGWIGAVLASNIPNVPPAVGIAIAAVDSALVLLEAELATQLGQPPTVTIVKRKLVTVGTPHGKTMKDAEKTAQATLAKL